MTWPETLEETWLGWSLPPPARAVRQAGWRPDPPAAYCRRCGVSAQPAEVGPGGCGTCRGRPVAADSVVRLGVYAGPLRDWIRAIKYRRWSAMASHLGCALGRATAALVEGPGPAVIVCPMPMPWARRLFRGIDHARAIAVTVAGALDAPLACPLVRADGPPQVTLGVARRARGGSGVRLRRGPAGEAVQGRLVVLVDDVCTTGASLRRAGRLLRPLGASGVVAAVLAVADPPGRRSRVGRPLDRAQRGVRIRDRRGCG